MLLMVHFSHLVHSAAVKPTLTIISNTLRVVDHLI